MDQPEKQRGLLDGIIPPEVKNIVAILADSKVQAGIADIITTGEALVLGIETELPKLKAFLAALQETQTAVAAHRKV